MFSPSQYEVLVYFHITITLTNLMNLQFLSCLFIHSFYLLIINILKSYYGWSYYYLWISTLFILFLLCDLLFYYYLFLFFLSFILFYFSLFILVLDNKESLDPRMSLGIVFSYNSLSIFLLLSFMNWSSTFLLTSFIYFSSYNILFLNLSAFYWMIPLYLF